MADSKSGFLHILGSYWIVWNHMEHIQHTPHTQCMPDPGQLLNKLQDQSWCWSSVPSVHILCPVDNDLYCFHDQLEIHNEKRGFKREDPMWCFPWKRTPAGCSKQLCIFLWELDITLPNLKPWAQSHLRFCGILHVQKHERNYIKLCRPLKSSNKHYPHLSITSILWMTKFHLD